MSEKKDYRKHIYLTKELYETVDKHKISISPICRTAITEYLKNNNYDIVYTEPDLILQIQCPKCHYFGQTTSVRVAYCRHCRNRFRLFPKNKRSRVRKILKGDRITLERKRRGLPIPKTETESMTEELREIDRMNSLVYCGSIMQPSGCLL